MLSANHEFFRSGVPHRFALDSKGQACVQRFTPDLLGLEEWRQAKVSLATCASEHLRDLLLVLEKRIQANTTCARPCAVVITSAGRRAVFAWDSTEQKITSACEILVDGVWERSNDRFDKELLVHGLLCPEEVTGVPQASISKWWSE